MAVMAKIYGFSLMPEDEQRLETIRQAFGWTRSLVIRELLKSCTIVSEAKVKVELERESFGVTAE
jgi:predicted DNA-binding protein